jgi:hypothetical protein
MAQLEMWRGDTTPFILTLDDTSYDLSAVTEIYFTAKVSPSDADPGLFQLTKSAGQIVVDGAQPWKATIRPLRSSTNTLTATTTLYWDVQVSVTGSPDTTETVDSGTLIVKPDITRAP